MRQTNVYLHMRTVMIKYSDSNFGTHHGNLDSNQLEKTLILRQHGARNGQLLTKICLIWCLIEYNAPLALIFQGKTGKCSTGSEPTMPGTNIGNTIGLVDNANYDCGNALQILHHIVMDCPLGRFPVSLQELQNLKGTSIQWPNNLDIRPYDKPLQ